MSHYLFLGGKFRFKRFGACSAPALDFPVVFVVLVQSVRGAVFRGDAEIRNASFQVIASYDSEGVGVVASSSYKWIGWPRERREPCCLWIEVGMPEPF